MKRDIKYIVKKVIIGLLIILILSFLKNCEVKAYVHAVTTNPSGSFNPVSDSRIVSSNNAWGTGTKPSYLTNTSPWFVDLGQYQSVSNKSGIYLSVDADYYIGIAVSTAGSTRLSDYILNERNPIKASNLRCGFGSSYKSGYDGNFAPNVTNFNITNASGQSPNGNFYHYVYRIRYNYYQQIARKDNYSGNFSCWFETSPSNALLFQIVNNYGDTEFYYYNNKFNVNLSMDSNTVILENITEQNQTMIDQNNTIIWQNGEINSSINGVNDSINNDNISGAESSVDTLLNNSAFQDSTGLTAVISTPLNFISNLSNTCSPISLSLPYFKNNTQVTLPCISSLLQDKIPTVKTLLVVVINGFIVYRILIELFYIVKSARNPEDDRIEVLDL